MRGFEIRNGWICVGGFELWRLAELAGGAPFFAYDRRMIAERVAALRRLLPATVRLSYSVKANPMPMLVQFVAGLVQGLDVSSIAELREGVNTVGQPKQLQFSGPGKSGNELRAAIAVGATISIESLAQLCAAAKIGLNLGQRPRLVLRVNPDFLARRSGMRMGGGPSQFGMDAELLPDILAQFKPEGVELAGFHIFWGSQNLDSEVIIDAYHGCVRLISGLPLAARAGMTELHIGSGWGIPYSERQPALDIERVAGGIQAIARDPLLLDPSGFRLTLESGRYLVGEAGIYVCRVLERKISRGKVFLITDGGLHHHLAASGNFGRAQLGNYPITIGNRIGSQEQEEVAVVGRLCTPLDRFAERATLPRAEAGDFVVIFQSGAYARSASPTDFIAHPPARELLI